MRPWKERVILNVGKRQCTRVPGTWEARQAKGNRGKRGAYLPLRKLCCSEGLASLLKRTEAHTPQTFLLPDPRRPLPGGGGRSSEDRLRVTTYQASPGLVRTGLPTGQGHPHLSAIRHVGAGQRASTSRAFCSNLSPWTDSRSTKLNTGRLRHCTEELFISRV